MQATPTGLHCWPPTALEPGASGPSSRRVGGISGVAAGAAGSGSGWHAARGSAQVKAVLTSQESSSAFHADPVCTATVRAGSPSAHRPDALGQSSPPLSPPAGAFRMRHLHTTRVERGLHSFSSDPGQS